MANDDDIDDEIKASRLKMERASAAMTEKLELLEQRLRQTWSSLNATSITVIKLVAIPGRFLAAPS